MATSDEYGDTPASAKSASIGGSYPGTIGDAGDKDFFKVSLKAGVLYQAHFTAQDGGAPAPQLYVTLCDANGQYLRMSQSLNTSISGQVDVSGDYYVLVASVAGATGSYRLMLSQPADDFPASSATNGSLTIGASTQGVFNQENDSDWFRVNLDAGTSYAFTAQLPPNNGYTDYAHIRLVDRNGNVIADPGSGLPVTVAASGQYYLEVNNDETVGAYTLTGKVVKDDIGITPDSAGRLQDGATVNSSIDYAADSDAFKLEVKAGHVYTLDATASAPQYNVFLESTYSSLYFPSQAAHTLLRQEGLNSTARTLTFKALDSGYITAAVNSSSLVSYQLTLKDIDQSDSGDTRSSATVVAPGATVTGAINSEGDVDVIKATLQAGVTYTLRTGGALANNRKLELRYQDYGSGTIDSALSFTPKTSGDYYWSLQGTGAATGDYTFTLGQMANDPPANASTGARIVPGDSVSGTLADWADIDWLAMPMQAGKSYWIKPTLSGDPIYLHMANLAIVDASGAVISTIRDPGNPSTLYSFTPATTGTYYLQVDGLGINGWGDTLYAHTGIQALQYSVAVTLSNDDHPQATPLNFGTRIDGKLEVVGDTDDFLLNLEQDHYYRIDLDLSKGSASTGSINSKYNYELTASFGSSAYQRIYEDWSPVLRSTWTGQHTLSVKDTYGYYDQYHLRVIDLGRAAYQPEAGNGVYQTWGNDATIDGGAGTDTVLVFGDGSNFKIGGGGTLIQQVSNDLTYLTMAGIERVAFTLSSDALALDANGVAGSAYRLYRAAFDRTPDKAGVGYWIGAMDHGTSLHDVAQGFIDSAEFKTLYGASPTDERFVDSLYKNVLHRAGEPAGVNYWLGVLKQGAQRADVLASFSESKENIEAVAKIIGNGFEYTPYG